MLIFFRPCDELTYDPWEDVVDGVAAVGVRGGLGGRGLTEPIRHYSIFTKNLSKFAGKSTSCFPVLMYTM